MAIFSPKILKKNKLLHNLSWIFIGNLLNAIFAFILNAVSARVFSVTDYGILNYIVSLTAFISSVSMLGLHTIIIKEIADEEEEVGNILASGLVLRFITVLLCVGIVSTYLFLAKKSVLSIKLFYIYSLSTIFTTFDLFIYWFRYKYNSKVSVIFKFISIIFSAILKIIAVIKKDIIIFAFGNVTETMIFSFLLFKYYTQERQYDLNPTLSRVKKIFKSSIPLLLSSILIAIYSQTDRIMLETMNGFESVANYSVSYTIANIIAVALAALVEAFRPEILRFFSLDKQRYRKLYIKLYGLIFWISTSYGIFILCFGKFILITFFGEKYISAYPTLSLIVWYSSFSYFGAVHNIYMVAEGHAKWVQVLTGIGALSNIILNFLFIPYMGASGAALASLLTQSIANFILPLCIADLRQTIIFITEGIFSVKLFNGKV